MRVMKEGTQIGTINSPDSSLAGESTLQFEHLTQFRLGVLRHLMHDVPAILDFLHHGECGVSVLGRIAGGGDAKAQVGPVEHVGVEASA